MQHCISGGVIVYRMVNGHPQYLLLRHTKGDHWDFAKGKVESGESVRYAAVRELHEEAGISAIIVDGFEQSVYYQYLHDGQMVSKTVYFFLGVANTPQITLSSEHTQGGWYTYDDAYARLTYATAKNLLKIAHEYVTQ